MDFEESMKILSQAYKEDPDGLEKMNTDMIEPLRKFSAFLASKHGLAEKEDSDKFFMERFAHYQQSLSVEYLEDNRMKVVTDYIGFVRGFMIEIMAAFAKDEGYENGNELERAMIFYIDAINDADRLKK